jgi:hypothetical protein
MSSNTLSGAGNSPANTKAQILHIGTGTIAAEVIVRLGSGVETPLRLHPGGIGFTAAGGYGVSLHSEATADQTVTFSGESGKVFTELVSVLAATVSSTLTTSTAVAGLTATLQPNTLYELDAVMLLQSAATGTSPRLSLTGPAAMDMIYWGKVAGRATSGDYTAFGDWANVENAPFANAPYPVQFRGWLKTGGVVSAPLGVSIDSETAGTAVSLVAGSYLRLIKRN